MDLVFNETRFSEIWIDPHYEVKHGDSVNDELILRLLECIQCDLHERQKKGKGFEYFEIDVELNNKLYLLVLVIPEHRLYLGVRNAYRRNS